MKLKSAIGAVLIIGCGGISANAQVAVGSETYHCQVAIAKAVARFEDKIADSIEGCLLAVVKCNQLSGPDIDACVDKLLDPTKGKCVVGKLAPAANYYGAGSSTAVDDSLIGKANATFTRQLSRCDPTMYPIDYSALNLSNINPASTAEVAEALNTNPDGAACLAHKRVLRTIPSREALIDQLANRPLATNLPTSLSSILFPANPCK